ncbi:MAG: hypothetical protein ABJE66_05030 [Deltaproteobacteria bacterium]
MGDPTRSAPAQAPAPAVGTDQEGAHEPASGSAGTTFTNHGVVPPVSAPVASFPGSSATSASNLAFGPTGYTTPLARPGDLQARADRLQIERLLESGSVSSGQEAIAALDMLLGMAPDERTKVIDQLDDRGFTNLLERLTDDQRARFATLVDAASNPKRRLQLWGAQHTSRARVDLQRYNDNFGEDDERTDSQQAAKDRFDRRKIGVDSTEREVTIETASLMKKPDLSVADVDAMRARKDRELDVEMKHNINLVAEGTPRADGSAVQWSGDEVDSLDRSLDKLPGDQADGKSSVATYTRRANRNFMQTRGGQYGTDEIDIYDNAHIQPPGREHVDPVEYSATHEVGHDVAHDHAAAFSKFSKAANWHDTDRATLDKQVGDSEVLEGVSGGVHLGNDLVKRDDDGKYHAVDDTALPNGKEMGADRWKYAASNAQEHFAETYAMAVESPESDQAPFAASVTASVASAGLGKRSRPSGLEISTDSGALAPGVTRMRECTTSRCGGWNHCSAITSSLVAGVLLTSTWTSNTVTSLRSRSAPPAVARCASSLASPIAALTVSPEMSNATQSPLTGSETVFVAVVGSRRRPSGFVSTTVCAVDAVPVMRIRQCTIGRSAGAVRFTRTASSSGAGVLLISISTSTTWAVAVWLVPPHAAVTTTFPIAAHCVVSVAPAPAAGVPPGAVHATPATAVPVAVNTWL